MPVIELVAPHARVRGTWAGGETHEIARWGDDGQGPRARLSVATIERPARFTAMAGRRRWLAVLDDGGGLTLTLASGKRTLVTGDHLAFDGGEEVVAEPGPRPARVWNAIVAAPPAGVALHAEVARAPTAHTFGPGVIAIHAPGALSLELGGTTRELPADHDLLAASSTPVTVRIASETPGFVVWAWLGLTPIGPRGAGVAPPSARVTVEGRALLDWPGFHAEMARAFGFPPSYGANLDAWIDCLTYLDDPAAGMTAVHAPPGGVVTLIVADVDALATGAPAIFEALVDGVAFVNERRRERGAGAVLSLAYDRSP
jgi:environmental stress-induced protein Ves